MFYKRLLLRSYGESLADEDRRKLASDCEELLVNLQRVDPDRKQRYMDLCKSSVTSLTAS